MTLEVRQLVLKSSIGDEPVERSNKGPARALTQGAGGDCCGDDEERQQLKSEILGECRRLLMEQLRQLRER
jgi:hypothetical protein